MNIKEKINFELLTIRDKRYDKALNFFLEILEGGKIVIDFNHPESMFYTKNGSILFEVEIGSDGNKYAWVNYDDIWVYLRRIYEFTFNESQSLIKKEIEKLLKIDSITPLSDKIFDLSEPNNNSNGKITKRNCGINGEHKWNCVKI